MTYKEYLVKRNEIRNYIPKDLGYINIIRRKGVEKLDFNNKRHFQRMIDEQSQLGRELVLHKRTAMYNKCIHKSANIGFSFKEFIDMPEEEACDICGKILVEKTKGKYYLKYCSSCCHIYTLANLEAITRIKIE